MDLAVVDSAQRHREFVADLAAQRAILREVKMVSARRLASTGYPHTPRRLTMGIGSPLGGAISVAQHEDGLSPAFEGSRSR